MVKSIDIFFDSFNVTALVMLQYIMRTWLMMMTQDRIGMKSTSKTTMRSILKVGSSEFIITAIELTHFTCLQMMQMKLVINWMHLLALLAKLKVYSTLKSSNEFVT